MFSAMLDAIKMEVVQILCRLQLQAPPGIPENRRIPAHSSSGTRPLMVSVRCSPGR